MLNRIIGWSLRNRLVTLFLGLLLLAAGTYSAVTLPVDVFPDLTAPTVTVLTDAHGMAPQEVETLVTFPIETAVNGSAGVRRVRSSSAHGISIVWVEFDWGTDIYRARQTVNEKLQLVASQMPEGIAPPTLAPITSIMGEVLLVGMSSDTRSPMEVRTAADWTVRKRLLAVPGVAQVVPIGGEVKQYQVRVHPERLRAYGVTLDEVLDAARTSNANASGGIYLEDDEQVMIRGIGRARAAEDIARTVVAVRDGSPVQIGDVADVRLGPKPRFGTASVNAEPAVILSVQKQPNVNTLELTERIDAELDRIQTQLPDGITIDRSVFRQADFISLAVDNVTEALRDGVILVVVILFLFLWNFRTTAISVLAIPLSLAAAFLVMRLFGVTVNTMTLGGLAIAIGALVDDAIIDVENTFRRLRENRLKPPDERESALRVVYDAAREVRGPIVNATLIITVVFVPLFFLSGVEGRMLRPLGLAYIVSILASLLVAVSVTPALCAYLLPDAPIMEHEGESWLVERLKRAYRKMLGPVLARPGRVIAGAGAALVAALAVVPFLGTGFLPPFQEGTLTITAVTAPGTHLETSDRLGTRLERVLLEHPAVVSTARRTGRAELDEHAQGVNAAEIDARLDLSEHELDEVMADLRETLAGVPGTNITIGQPIGHRIDHMLSGTRAAIAVKVFGPDLYELRRIAGQIQTVVEGVPGTADVATDQQADVPQLRIEPDRATIARYGLTPGALVETIDAAFTGEVVSQVLEGRNAFDLTVRLDEASRADADRIARTLIDTPTGGKVALGALADISLDRGPNRISREDVQRKIVVQSNVAGRDVGGVVADIRSRIEDEVSLPTGYFIEYGGQFESGRRALRMITILSLLAVAAIFIILFQEFGSARTALLVMVNLPLALVGGIFAVLFTDGVLNVATLVGFITLFGIAVRNGILLVSHYNHLLAEGKTLREAVVQGSMERLNPILMTALTAGLALIPLALGGGEPGKEIQAPLAVVVLGGLLTSTALNMFVVPTLVLRYGSEAPREAAAGEPSQDDELVAAAS